MPRSHSIKPSSVTTTVVEDDAASGVSAAGPSNQALQEDLALRDADTPENQAIWDALMAEDYGAKNLGGCPTAPGWATDEGSHDALYPMRAEAEKKKSADTAAIAGGVGASVAGAGVAAAGVGGGVVAGASQASTSASPAATATQAPNPLMAVPGVLPGVAKVGRNAFKAGDKAKSAHDKWAGGEQRHALNADGIVETSIRGQDTAEANGFMKEAARDDAKASAHAAAKTVTGGLKATSKVLDVAGVPVSEAVDVLGLNPMASAGQVGSGAHKVAKGGADIAEHQAGKKAARSGEKEARARGDLIEHGLHQAKTGHSRARNRAGQQVGLGSLEATKGGLGIAQFADPTGGTAAAHAAVAGTYKVAAKGTQAYNAVQDGRRWEKIQRMREAANAGDPKAAKWMLANDPRSASAQMLMHAQVGSDEDKAFAQQKIAATLDLGEDGQRELATGKLSEFDKLYARRTGQDIESQLDPTSAAMYAALGPGVDKAGKLGKKAKKKLSGGRAEPAEASSSTDAGPLDPHLDEYQRVTAFRNQKTYEEMVDKAEQKSLKKRKKAGEADEAPTGELYHPDNFASAEEMVDETHAATMKGTLGKIDKQQIAAAKATNMPWMKNKGMPEDIRGGVIALEQQRRDAGGTVGQDLPRAAPTGDWIGAQDAANVEEKASRKEAKAAGTLPGQVAKAERKEQARAAKASKRSKKTG